MIARSVNNKAFHKYAVGNTSAHRFQNNSRLYLPPVSFNKQLIIIKLFCSQIKLWLYIILRFGNIEHMTFKLKNSFLPALCLLCLTYVAFQFFFTYYATISVDEFWFTHWINRYRYGLPYRDFLPYKTTLGYYLLLPVLLYSKGWLDPLLNIKNALAIVNALLFFISALWLSKFFNKWAVLITTTLIITAEFVLSYSTNVRVDLLAYWFCLFSVLLLYEKRFLLPGILLGLAFLTSQKAIWYIAASNIALTFSWLMFFRNWSECKRIMLFNLSFLLTVLSYIIFWSILSSFHSVIHSMFYEAYIMYQLDWYEEARKLFWQITLFYNPLLFLLWPIAILILFIRNDSDEEYKKRFFAIIYGACILLALIPYKQVFPYYMTATIPAFLLLYTAFFSWLITLSTIPDATLKTVREPSGKIVGTIITILFAYITCFAYVAYLFKLPLAYLLILFIPLLLLIFVFKKTEFLLIKLIGLCMLFVGCIYPLTLFFLNLPLRNGEYQRANLAVARSLLSDGDYLAGIELFYDKNQPIEGLRHLDGVAINYLYDTSDKFKPVMLESLYRSPNITLKNTIENLKKSKVKFYVDNYRIQALPPLLKVYLSENYEHYWGSIYTYAPLIKAGADSFILKFNGEYQVESKEAVMLNGKQIHPFSLITLMAGKYRTHTNENYRLKWIPLNNTQKINYTADHWEKMLN